MASAASPVPSPQPAPTPSPPPSTPAPTPAPPTGTVLDNGVIRIRMNDIAPLITGMWVNGRLVVPHDNIGADFQMNTRSSRGDGYNPNQGGDCRGNPSILRAIYNWNGVSPGTPAEHGALMEIDPRNYNEPAYPGCLGTGEVTPYDMKFGVTLGDSVTAPRSLMVIDMSIRKDAGSVAEDLVKNLSELPVIFFDNAALMYVYYSVDTTPADGQDFRPMQVATPTANTHDTRLWPALTNYFIADPARVIMLCDRADAVASPTVGNCVGLYSHEGSQMQVSRRDGTLHNLTLITSIIRDPADPVIEDYDEHTQRRLLVVGTPDTVAATIAWAEEHLAASDWKRW